MHPPVPVPTIVCEKMEALPRDEVLSSLVDAGTVKEDRADG